MKYEHIFFDLDRTLWDYDANAFKALSLIHSEYKLEKYFSSLNEFYQIFSVHNEQLWDDYRKGLVRKEELRNRRFFQTLREKNVVDHNLSSQIGERFMYLIPRLNILLPNTIKVLDYLNEKAYSMYILTNGFIKTQERKMVNSTIDHYFKRVFSSEELGRNKPSKEIFHWAISNINAKKSKCLMVGDDLKLDVQGAMKYGIDAVWFNPRNEVAIFKPSYIIHNLAELVELL